MKLEDVIVSVIVGFALWCLYAAIYEQLQSRSAILKQTVGL